jgi:hypothetical protein
MATTVRSIVLWRKETENQPGALASSLELFASADADLQIVMGYRYPGNQAKAAVELSPVAGKKLLSAAETAGFKASGIPTLLVEVITGRGWRMLLRRLSPTQRSTSISSWRK